MGKLAPSPSSRGLVSLWDMMKKLYATHFLDLARLLTQMERTLDQVKRSPSTLTLADVLRGVVHPEAPGGDEAVRLLVFSLQGACQLSGLRLSERVLTDILNEQDLPKTPRELRYLYRVNAGPIMQRRPD